MNWCRRKAKTGRLVEGSMTVEPESRTERIARIVFGSFDAGL